MGEMQVDDEILDAPRDGWQDFLQRLAHGVRRVALAHPKAFPLVASRPVEAPWLRPPLRSITWVEAFLDGLIGEGFSDDAAAGAYRAFTSFLLGHLLLEVASLGADVGPLDVVDDGERPQRAVRRPPHRRPAEQGPVGGPLGHRVRGVAGEPAQPHRADPVGELTGFTVRSAGTIHAMKLYADGPVRRTRQVVGDLLLVLWVVLWVRLAGVVHDATLALAAPGRRMASAGDGLASRLRDAGEAVDRIPLVGDDVRSPFDGAGRAADQIAAAGASQVEAVQHLAFWLGLVVGAAPVMVLLAVYLPVRWRFVRQATAGRRFVDASEDLTLFALRAMANQPMHRLARVSDDPVGAWQAGDRDVVRALAALELRDSGLAVPRDGLAAR